MAFCHGCGGGGAGSSADAAPSAAASPAATVSPPATSPPATSPPPVSAPAVVNRAPTITGNAIATARVGETYNWQPIASDPDGDAIRFSAVNLPGWASIDPDNGRISGTPGQHDVGIYESISIAVADQSQQTAGAAFSITVSGGEAGAGVASLRWETPPSKVNGSPLDDLAGYRILYGHDSDDLDHSVIIDNPSTNSYEFTSLPSGVWYFTVVGVNASGLEGPPTTVATKSI
ncbi:MAG TPA: putative Ig domain-containing protein [Steroidobacteraceae bacterium]|nr:putative Ig domain-containing protein [Steroidobacteraceae bacterium]